MAKKNMQTSLGVDLDLINKGINKVQDTHQSVSKLVKSDFKLDHLAETVEHIQGLYQLWNGKKGNEQAQNDKVKNLSNGNANLN